MSIWNYRPGVGAIGDSPPPPVDDEIQPPAQTMQPPAPSADQAQRWFRRMERERGFLAANPNRRPAPMGRNADGSINWDISTGLGAWGAEQDRRRRAAQDAGIGPGATAPIRPGAFNAAAGTGGPRIQPPPTGTGAGGGY